MLGFVATMHSGSYIQYRGQRFQDLDFFTCLYAPKGIVTKKPRLDMVSIQ